jgi:parvulin-like peptidyl-prolyl isomerase
MGMMAKMRSLAPWFIITVGGLFVLFMVLSDSQVVQIMGQRSNNIGYVNGEPITYQQFSNYLEIVRQQQKAQTGEDVDESQMEALRDQVWDALVNQMLIDEKIDDFGIVVTDEEIRDIILGPNPPAFLKQNFIDSTGVFNRQLYEQAIFSPQNRDAVIQAEETIRAQLIQEKLRSFLTGSIIVSDSEVKRKYIEQNVKISAEFALFEYNRIPDSAVTVTDEDLKNYYEEHKSDYKIDPQRKLKYVLFERKASEEDSASIKNNLVEIIKDLEQDTSTFRTYVNIYSDQPYSKDTLTVNQIHPEAVKILSEAKEGEIIGPVLTTEGYAVYKLVDKFRGSDEFAEASHILVSGNDDAAKQKADSIYQAIQNGADFAQTAIEVSDDPGSGKRGGYLGWFTKGQMVPEFEKAVFNGRVGVVQRPFTSQFGYHIVKVLGKTNYKYVVEKIVNKIEPSGTTRR